MKGMLENFTKQAIAIAAPSHIARDRPGRSSQRTNAYRAVSTVAAQARSNVANPACPKIGGVDINSTIAHNPAFGENQSLAHA